MVIIINTYIASYGDEFKIAMAVHLVTYTVVVMPSDTAIWSD